VQDGLDVLAHKQGEICLDCMAANLKHCGKGEIRSRDTERSIGFNMTVPKEMKKDQRTKSLVLYSCSLAHAPARWDSPGKNDL